MKLQPHAPARNRRRLFDCLSGLCRHRRTRDTTVRNATGVSQEEDDKGCQPSSRRLRRRTTASRVSRWSNAARGPATCTLLSRVGKGVQRRGERCGGLTSSTPSQSRWMCLQTSRLQTPFQLHRCILFGPLMHHSPHSSLLSIHLHPAPSLDCVQATLQTPWDIPQFGGERDKRQPDKRAKEKKTKKGGNRLSWLLAPRTNKTCHGLSRWRENGEKGGKGGDIRSYFVAFVVFFVLFSWYHSWFWGRG